MAPGTAVKSNRSDGAQASWVDAPAPALRHPVVEHGDVRSL
jgi:hypothetical protein